MTHYTLSPEGLFDGCAIPNAFGMGSYILNFRSIHNTRRIVFGFMCGAWAPRSQALALPGFEVTGDWWLYCGIIALNHP